jgi:hypothetical protein
VYQHKLGRYLYQQVSRLFSFKNTTDVRSRPPNTSASTSNKEAVWMDRWQMMPGQEREDQVSVWLRCPFLSAGFSRYDPFVLNVGEIDR